MIADAVDTVFTLGWALLAWILLTAAVGTLALYAAVTIAWTAVRVTGRAAKASCAWLSWRLTAFEVSEVESGVRDAPVPVDARLDDPRPSWARTDKDTA